MLATVAALSGCASGFTLAQADVDPTVLTSSAPSGAVDPGSDEAAVRNAVSSADLDSARERDVPWANAATGSRGVISVLTETKQADTRCRRFTTSRESYDGVAMYEGSACMVAPGIWQLQKFAQAGSK